MKKGYEESQKPGTVVVMLIPSRTDTSYFHDYILHGKADEIRFLRGRLKFTDEDGNAKDSAPFPSAVVIWRSKDMGQSLRDMVLDLKNRKKKPEPEKAEAAAGDLVPGRDFDPDTGEVLKDGHPVDDQKKIVAIGQRAAQA